MTRLTMIGGPLFLLLFSFQNCAKQAGGSNGLSSNSADGIVMASDVSQFDTVHYAPDVVQNQSEVGLLLDLNLTTQMMQVTLPDGSSSSCSLDANRLNELQQILQQSEICKPNPPAEGTVTCMAIPNFDVTLASSSTPGDKIALGIPICDQGAYLCSSATMDQSADQSFRAILQDLLSSPPAGCTSN